MRRFLDVVLPGGLARTACATLVALLLGTGAHLLHHVADPDCGRSPAPGAHACTSCASLHASVLGETPASDPEPPVVHAGVRSARAADAPRCPASPAGIPRAPPRG